MSFYIMHSPSPEFRRWNQEFRIMASPGYISPESGKMCWYISAMPLKSIVRKHIFPIEDLGKNGAPMDFAQTVSFGWRNTIPTRCLTLTTAHQAISMWPRKRRKWKCFQISGMLLSHQPLFPFCAANTFRMLMQK